MSLAAVQLFYSYFFKRDPAVRPAVDIQAEQQPLQNVHWSRHVLFATLASDLHDMSVRAWPYLPSETPQGQFLFQSSLQDWPPWFSESHCSEGLPTQRALLSPLSSSFIPVPWSEGFSGLLLLCLAFVFHRHYPQ